MTGIKGDMLKLHRVFDKVVGIILGKHERYDDLGTGGKLADLLVEQLDSKKAPILAEFDTCHTSNASISHREES